MWLSSNQLTPPLVGMSSLRYVLAQIIYGGIQHMRAERVEDANYK